MSNFQTKVIQILTIFNLLFLVNFSEPPPSPFNDLCPILLIFSGFKPPSWILDPHVRMGKSTFSLLLLVTKLHIRQFLLSAFMIYLFDANICCNAFATQVQIWICLNSIETVTQILLYKFCVTNFALQIWICLNFIETVTQNSLYCLYRI